MMAIINKPYTFVEDTIIDPVEANENFDVLYNEINGKIDDENLGNRTIDDLLPPGSNTGTVTALLGGLANRIRTITGESNWRENPKTNLSSVKRTLDDLADVVDALEEFSKSFVNIITMWSGYIDDIPDGWALCDGTNGTPDLRDKFIVGAGNDYEVGDTGGEATVTLTLDQIPEHSHSGTTDATGDHTHEGSTNTAGAHTHTVSIKTGSAGSGLGGLRSPDNRQDTNRTTSSSGAHSHTLTIQPAGEHEHSFETDSVGGGEEHENRPPFYALAFIMRVE